MRTLELLLSGDFSALVREGTKELGVHSLLLGF
jgi:hypothetical protein